MLNLFDPATKSSLLERLARVEAGSSRLWGKMSPAQMCAHCAVALAVANGDSPHEQAMIGKLLSWLVRKKLLGPEPFSKNGPTDPSFVVRDPRDFDVERTKLVSQIELFAARGPEHAATRIHTFLGKMTGTEWGVMMAKHLDHHLRQFGV